jgi:hypothetical protein
MSRILAWLSKAIDVRKDLARPRSIVNRVSLFKQPWLRNNSQGFSIYRPSVKAGFENIRNNFAANNKTSLTAPSIPMKA